MLAYTSLRELPRRGYRHPASGASSVGSVAVAGGTLGNLFKAKVINF
jgi:hypothetical protein